MRSKTLPLKNTVFVFSFFYVFQLPPAAEHATGHASQKASLSEIVVQASPMRTIQG